MNTSLNMKCECAPNKNTVFETNIQHYQLKRALHTEVCAHLCWEYARTNAHKCAHWATANAHQAITKNAHKYFYAREMHRKYAHSCIYVGEMHKKYAHSANQWMRKQQNECANNNYMSGKCTRNMRMHLNLVSQIHKKYAHSGWRTARQNRIMDPKLHQFKIETDNVLLGDLLQSKEPRTSKDFRRRKSENKIST